MRNILKFALAAAFVATISPFLAVLAVFRVAFPAVETDPVPQDGDPGQDIDE